jgi:hypothetical protein
MNESQARPLRSRSETIVQRSVSGLCALALALQIGCFSYLPVQSSPPTPAQQVGVVINDRGRVLLGDADAVEARYGMRPPCLPWIAGPVIGVADAAATEALLARAGVAALRRAPEGLAVAAPASLGGLIVFGPADVA